MGYFFFFFFQAEDGIRDAQESRGLGDVYKRQVQRCDTILYDSAIRTKDKKTNLINLRGRAADYYAILPYLLGATSTTGWCKYGVNEQKEQRCEYGDGPSAYFALVSRDIQHGVDSLHEGGPKEQDQTPVCRNRGGSGQCQARPHWRGQGEAMDRIQTATRIRREVVRPIQNQRWPKVDGEERADEHVRLGAAATLPPIRASVFAQPSSSSMPSPSTRGTAGPTRTPIWATEICPIRRRMWEELTGTTSRQGNHAQTTPDRDHEPGRRERRGGCSQCGGTAIRRRGKGSSSSG
eukprot:TRINITY_DN1392_c0_g1_i16.p1 TRINITY_DN1392_c0_g1~~TRINITY_DN1392_c0_g1_i16.p1  ORF type:complete len:293 (-),score=15.77 TRINITY_DN1392_c0_g1_i16:1922-2800(-)